LQGVATSAAQLTIVNHFFTLQKMDQEDWSSISQRQIILDAWGILKKEPAVQNREYQ